MYNKPLVPLGFDVPQKLETDRIRLRPLTVHDAVKDYDAVMSSEHRLRNVFQPGGHWPSGLTLQQNIIELGWHQTEFQLRTSFAYTVVDPEETQVLGCVYIYPTSVKDYEVEVSMWVRESEVEQGLDEHLFERVDAWLAQDWPFEKVAFPGRSIEFKTWNTWKDDE